MERNHIIGFILLFATMLIWTFMSKPDEATLAKNKRMQDSLAAIEVVEEGLKEPVANIPTDTQLTPAAVSDSVLLAQNTGAFGIFAPASIGEEQSYVLENEKVKLTFSSLGGKITAAELKDHVMTVEVEGEKNTTAPVVLMNDERDVFEYFLPLANVSRGGVSTGDLYFTGTTSGNTLTLAAKTTNGLAFTQTYTLNDNYGLDYKVDFNGLESYLDRKVEAIEFNWEHYLHGYELNRRFEQQYSAIYYKKSEKSHPSDCGCMRDDEEELDDNTLDWVAHVNQYFNTSIIAEKTPFVNAYLESKAADLDEDDYLEKLTTKAQLPLVDGQTSYDMSMYVGPNDYKLLKSYDMALEDVIPFGTSLFGTINRYIIRPMFDFFNSWLGNLGLAIILVIFIIKMLLYPLMYKMLKSQALMGALKPEVEKLKAKFKDDAQKTQLETMKMYREYGVSPLGGCMPMIIQMPIWYALFRYFPATLTFRQESFLWANDLSSYDAFFKLPFEIPFIGAHLSLFTILWAVSTLIYTYYNTKHMDMTANPAMKYMQYFMPIMFLGFFNTYASALTCYMFFSNLINILQTVVTKKFVFDDEKLKAELRKKKAKPKKKGGFQARLEAEMKKAQELQAKKNKK